MLVQLLAVLAVLWLAVDVSIHAVGWATVARGMWARIGPRPKFRPSHTRYRVASVRDMRSGAVHRRHTKATARGIYSRALALARR